MLIPLFLFQILNFLMDWLQIVKALTEHIHSHLANLQISICLSKKDCYVVYFFFEIVDGRVYLYGLLSRCLWVVDNLTRTLRWRFSMPLYRLF